MSKEANIGGNNFINLNYFSLWPKQGEREKKQKNIPHKKSQMLNSSVTKNSSFLFIQFNPKSTTLWVGGIKSGSWARTNRAALNSETPPAEILWYWWWWWWRGRWWWWWCWWWWWWCWWWWWREQTELHSIQKLLQLSEKISGKARERDLNYFPLFDRCEDSNNKSGQKLPRGAMSFLPPQQPSFSEKISTTLILPFDTKHLWHRTLWVKSVMNFHSANADVIKSLQCKWKALKL